MLVRNKEAMNDKELEMTDTEAWDLVSPIYYAAEGCSAYSVKKALREFGEEYVRRRIASGDLKLHDPYDEDRYIPPADQQ